MFKRIVTLVRGQAHEASEAAVDAHALTILRQQIRDCGAALMATRRAVAVAVAQNAQELAQHERLQQRIADLEGRAVEALRLGKSELAHEAAETIAHLEAERDASEAAQRSFQTEIARLRNVVRKSEARLKQLERGQRIATVNDKAQRLQETGAGSTLNALRDAEETLQRLERRQKEIDVAAAALAEMEAATDPCALSEKLAAQGCGAPTRTRTEDVLARLEQRLAASVKTEA